MGVACRLVLESVSASMVEHGKIRDEPGYEDRRVALQALARIQPRLPRLCLEPIVVEPIVA